MVGGIIRAEICSREGRLGLDLLFLLLDRLLFLLVRLVSVPCLSKYPWSIQPSQLSFLSDSKAVNKDMKPGEEMEY